jgi:hypothetical protein
VAQAAKTRENLAAAAGKMKVINISNESNERNEENDNEENNQCINMKWQ